MLRIILASISALFITACAGPQEAPLKQTASGYPEGLISNINIDSARSRIIEGCTVRGLMVHESTGNQVVCGKMMEGNEAAVAQMLIGNSYSTTPQRKIRLTFFQLGADVKILAEQWIETQMAMGQLRRQELKTSRHNNDVQLFLNTLGAY